MLQILVFSFQKNLKCNSKKSYAFDPPSLLQQLVAWVHHLFLHYVLVIHIHLYILSQHHIQAIVSACNKDSKLSTIHNSFLNFLAESVC